MCINIHCCVVGRYCCTHVHGVLRKTRRVQKRGRGSIPSSCSHSTEFSLNSEYHQHVTLCPSNKEKHQNNDMLRFVWWSRHDVWFHSPFPRSASRKGSSETACGITACVPQFSPTPHDRLSPRAAGLCQRQNTQ